MTQEVFTKQFFQATRMWLFKFVAPLFLPSLAWEALHYLAIHRFLTATSPIFSLAGYCLNFAVVAAKRMENAGISAPVQGISHTLPLHHNNPICIVVRPHSDQGNWHVLYRGYTFNLRACG